MQPPAIGQGTTGTRSLRPETANVVPFRLPILEIPFRPVLTPKGHAFVAIARLKRQIEALEHDDRAEVVDQLEGMLADFVSCPDGCHER